MVKKPTPGGNPAIESWTKNIIGTDGKLDVASRSSQDAYISFQTDPNTWNSVHIYHIGGGEGMGSGDVNGDGDRNPVLSGLLARNP